MNAAAPDIPQALERALALLNAGPWHPMRVRAYVITADSRYCALTLDNFESYIVDFEAGRHLHYPEAGVTGVRGNVVVLSPDDKRFNIEGWFVDDLEVDPGAPDRPWRVPK